MKETVITILVALGLVYGLLRVYVNWETRTDPPAACQFMGGHWGIWDGWQCY